MTIKFKRQEIPIKLLATGHRLTAPHFTLQGAAPGKTVYIQSGTHGGELAGHGAILELLSLLRRRRLRGTIHLLPLVNPVGINQRVGDFTSGVFDLTTGSNFNRTFFLLARRGKKPGDPRVDVDAFAKRHRETAWPAVKQRFRQSLLRAVSGLRRGMAKRGIDQRADACLKLQRIASQADVVIDLHTGDIAPRYLYAPPWRPEAMFSLGVRNILLLSDQFAGAMDEATIVPWLMLTDAFRRLGRAIPMEVEGYTLELGSIETLDRDAMRRDAKRLLSLLQFHGLVAGKRAVEDSGLFRLSSVAHYVSYTAPESGLAIFTKEPGESVKPGEALAVILSPQKIRSLNREEAETPVIAAEDGILITRKASPIVSQGQPLFRMMTHVETIPRP